MLPPYVVAKCLAASGSTRVFCFVTRPSEAESVVVSWEWRASKGEHLMNTCFSPNPRVSVVSLRLGDASEVQLGSQRKFGEEARGGRLSDLRSVVIGFCA